MTTPAPEKLITADEFERMPESRDHELIDGRLVPVMPASPLHGDLVGNVHLAVGVFIRQHDLGKAMVNDPGFYVRRNPDRLRAPDIAFIPRERIPAEGLPDSFTDIVPTLAVEVVSPNDVDHVVHEKVDDFLAFGVERVWVVRSSNRTVTVHRPDISGRVYGIRDTLTSDDAGFAIHGFALPIADIFA